MTGDQIKIEIQEARNRLALKDQMLTELLRARSAVPKLKLEVRAMVHAYVCSNPKLERVFLISNLLFLTKLRNRAGPLKVCQKLAEVREKNRIIIGSRPARCSEGAGSL